MELETVILNGIPLMALVFGLVEFSKKLGVQGRALTILSACLGVVTGLGFQLAAEYPAAGRWIGIAVFSLAVGLAASGVYDFVNQRFPQAGDGEH